MNESFHGHIFCYVISLTHVINNVGMRSLSCLFFQRKIFSPSRCSSYSAHFMMMNRYLHSGRDMKAFKWLYTCRDRVLQRKFSFTARKARKYQPQTIGEILIAYLTKKQILLRGFMCKKRQTNIPYFKDIWPIYNYSNIAGHAAFVSMAFSYTESDIMMLRLFALSGLSLSIIFQYYREVPLWIPIRWNGLFVIINIAMIAILVKKERDASALPDEQKELFVSCFQPLGMIPTEFLHLMHIAKRHEFKKGEVISKQGEKRTRLLLLKEGSGRVMRDGSMVGTVKDNNFVGEMSFLAFHNQELKSKKIEQPKQENQSKAINSDEVGSKKGNLEQFKGTCTVVCSEDCIVYSWDYMEFHSLVASYPLIGVAVERKISSDLNMKMTDSYRHRANTRAYIAMLFKTTRNGELLEKDVEMLRKEREKRGLSYEDHTALLQELGIKYKAETEFERKYREDLHEKVNSLGPYQRITWEEKKGFRDQRLKNKISTEFHLNCLAELQWGYDDWERGSKKNFKKGFFSSLFL